MAYTYEVDIKTNVDLKSAEALEKYLEKIKKTSDEINSAHGADEINKAYERNAKAMDNVRKTIETAGKKFNEAKANLSTAIGAKDAQGINKYAQEMKSLQNVLNGMKDALNYDAEIKGTTGLSMYKQELTDISNIMKGINSIGDRANTAIGQSGARELSEATKVTRDRVENLKKNFSQLGSIIKSSFVDSIKVGTGAIKKYFGLLGKSAKGIFNLIKKGFTGGSNSESSNPLVSLLKKGVTFYGIKKLIGDLSDFIAKTREMGGVAGSAFSEYNGHLASIKESLRTIGTVGAVGLIQALTPVLNVLNYITQAAANAAMALASLFGFGDTVKSVISGYEQTADAIGGVGSAAKEAKMDLQSFDKLNNNASDQGGGGGGGAGKAIKALPKDPKNIKWLEELFTLMNNGEWEKAGSHVAKGINTVVKSLYGLLKDPKITKGMSSFNDALTDFLKGLLDIDTSMIGRTLGAGINLITFYINDLYNQLNQKNILKDTGKKIADFFDGLFDEVDWTALGQSLVTGIRSAFDVLSGFVEQAQNTDLGNKAGTAIKELLLGSIDRLFGSGGAEEIGKSIGGLINLAFDFIHGAIGDGETNKKIFEAIKTTITTAIQSVDASKMKDAAVDIANLIGDLLNTAADTINDNTGAISDAVAGTVNGLADSGALSNVAKGVTGFFLALANLMGQTVTKIDWIEVGTSILEGISKAIEDNPAGMQFIITAFSILFGAKLVGKIASFGISTLASAIGQNIASSIATKLAANSSTSAVAGGLSSLFASPVITAAATAAGTAMAASVVSAIVAGVKDKKSELTDLAKATNAELVEMQERLANSTNKANGMILFQADTLDEYSEKIDGVSDSFDDLLVSLNDASKGAEGFFTQAGDRSGKLKALKGYLNDLETAGMSTTEEFQDLKSAIERYESVKLGSDKEKALRDAITAAEDCQQAVLNSKAAVEALDRTSLDNVGVEFSNFKAGTKFSDTELVTIEQSGVTAGKTLVDGEISGVNSKRGESIDAIKSSATLSDNDKNELYNQSKDVGKHTVGGIMAGIEEKKPELSNTLSIMSQLIPSSLRRLLKINSPSKIMEEDVGQWVTLGIAEGITDETGAVTSAMADIQDAMMSSFDTNDMSKYFDFSGVPRSIAISPEVQKAQMQSILAQNQSTAGFGSALSALNHQLNKGNGNNMKVDVYLDANNKLGEFVINTVNGQIVKSGGF